MPVIGVGIDVVDIDRFVQSLERTPNLRGRLFTDAEVVTEESGRPRLLLRGTVLARADHLGAVHVHVSLSHDAGIASAVVVLEA